MEYEHRRGVGRTLRGPARAHSEVCAHGILAGEVPRTIGIMAHSEQCPYYAVLYVQSVLIMQCLKYAMRPCYVVRYMQRVRIIQCFICNVSVLFSALYAKCPYYSVLYMQSVLIM